MYNISKITVSWHNNFNFFKKEKASALGKYVFLYYIYFTVWKYISHLSCISFASYVVFISIVIRGYLKHILNPNTHVAFDIQKYLFSVNIYFFALSLLALYIFIIPACRHRTLYEMHNSVWSFNNQGALNSFCVASILLYFIISCNN